MSTSCTGHCGESLKPEAQTLLLQFIRNAAEERQLQRAERTHLNFATLSTVQSEWALYSLIFRSIGYSQFTSDFEKLAELRPYQQIHATLHQEESKAVTLNAWLQELQISFVSKTDVPLFHPSYQPLAAKLNLQVVKESVQKNKPVRPVNHPLRRLTGLYWHLWNTKDDGLLKAWLRFLQKAQVILEDNKKPRKAILQLLDDLFQTSDQEELAWMMLPTSKNLFESKNKLIGQQRQLVVFINAVVPFFLRWARFHKDRKLEKTLFGLFLVLPPEGENFKILEMKKALSKGGGVVLPKSLSVYQGLIQLYDDFCEVAQGNCENCNLPRLLKNL